MMPHGRTPLPRMTLRPEPAAIPRFPVDLTAPDLTPWRAGNTGLLGFTTIESQQPGPHVMLTALMHGNEIGGAIVLARLLERLLASAIRLRRGRLTLGFLNLAAFERFDPAQPTASRFIDEDMNRVWDPAVLDGPRTSLELDRARDIRPIVDTADLVLDLHSMLWPSDPLILSGAGTSGRELAVALGVPPSSSPTAATKRVPASSTTPASPKAPPPPSSSKPASTGSPTPSPSCTNPSTPSCATPA